MLIYSNSWTTFYTKQWKHFKNDTQRWTMPYRNRWNPWLCSMTTWAMLASGHFKQYQTASNDMKCAGTKNSLRDLWNNAVMTPGRVCWLIRTDYIQSDWTRGRMVKGRRGYTTIGLPGRGLAWMSFKLSWEFIQTQQRHPFRANKPKQRWEKILWSLILEPTKGMCCLRQRQMGCPDTDSSQNLPKTLLAGRVAALVPSSQS